MIESTLIISTIAEIRGDQRANEYSREQSLALANLIPLLDRYYPACDVKSIGTLEYIYETFCDKCGNRSGSVAKALDSFSWARAERSSEDYPVEEVIIDG